MRWLLFSVFLFMNILVNVDHGIVPAATDDIEKDLKIGETQLGLFGSLVFLGNLIGGIFSFTLMNKFNRKLLLVVSLILNGVCLYTFTLTSAYWFLVLNRIVVGIFQVTNI
jgi:predicted MFS family arabinose efflux permease